MKKSILTIQCSRKILNDCLLFVFSLSVWVNSFIMFMWETYYNGIFRIPLTILKYLGLAAIVFFVLLNNRNLKIKQDRLVEFFVAFVLVAKILLLATYKIAPGYFTYWAIPFYVLFLMLLEDEEKKIILKNLIILFMIFSAPSIIYGALGDFGVELPYSILYSDQILKANAYTYYLHYPMGLIFNQWGFLRPCGIFDEPGFIGTTAAMFFAIRLQMGIRKGNKWLLGGLLIIGICSTSLAAVVLFAIAVVIYAVNQKNYKTVGAFFAFLVFCILFVNIEFNNEVLNSFQERLTDTDGVMAGNSREEEIFKKAFDDIVENDPLTLLFGNGYDSKRDLLPTDGSCSYRTFIFEAGLIGLGLLLLLLFTIFFHSYKNKYSFIHFIVFLASLYQRPNIIIPLYITIFIVGFSAIEKKNYLSAENHRRRQAY